MSTHDPASNQLVALNADIVGYSRLMADDFEATTEKVNSYHHLVQSEVAQAGGTLVNFVGDNFMAVFDVATEAMRAAIGITKLIEDDNQDPPEHKKVRFRMGMDRGEVFVSGDGSYFGEALNIAARIQAIAPPGGISVSGHVYRDLDEPALRFRAKGRQHLKNIPERVEVYEFADLPADELRLHRRESLRLEAPSIAILPPHVESVDDSVRGLAGLIRSDLIHKLAQNPQLRVIDVGVSGQSPGSSGAPYILESGIHQVGTHVRIYVKLMEVSTLNVVYTDRWDSSTEELLALSDTVTDHVARALEIELIIGETGQFYEELGDPAALDAIFQGWYHLSAGTEADWLRAVELFDTVVQTHPDSPIGHGLSAFAHWAGVAEGAAQDPARHLSLARAEAMKTLDIGDPTGLGHMVLGAILLAEGDAARAVELVETAVITRPTCDVTFAVEGSIMRYLGGMGKVGGPSRQGDAP
ncbi:MAG: adenylate/guanylate cyclase domain-containing protein [Acidimicrobiia bacterium]